MKCDFDNKLADLWFLVSSTVNYYGQKGELRGCINDVKNIKAFLCDNYHIDEILVLTDDQKDPSKIPTRANILAGFRWLKKGAQSGDSLILHYSGHGGSVKDTDGDEEDGMDETLIPVDYATAGQIVDDEIHELLCQGLPKGVRLTAIMDCCHSGSVLVSSCFPDFQSISAALCNFV
jgi:hypothetical protein